ncbi:hypothetical protein M426DRAFT_63588, partial [Hypoxylon sp. CI-4A]
TLPTRPWYGTEGYPVQLKANYFKLELRSMIIFRYRIVFADSENKPVGRKLSRVITLLLDALALVDEDHKDKVATDFADILISYKKFKNKSFSIQYMDEKESEPRENAVSYQIKLELQTSFATKTLLDYVNDPTTACDKQGILQALNIILNYYPQRSDNHATIGSSRSFPFQPATLYKWQPLSHGLIAVRGYYTSMQLAVSRLLVNVNITHGPFYPAITVERLIQAYQAAAGQDYSIHRLSRFLSGIRVERLYGKNDGGRRVRRIFGLASKKDGTTANGEKTDNAPKVDVDGAGPQGVRFWLEEKDKNNGSWTTVLDYFKQRVIVKAGALLVNVGTLQFPTYLPSDQCEILRGQKVKRTNVSDQDNIKSIVEEIHRVPGQDIYSIEHGAAEALGLASSSGNAGLVIPVDSKLITVGGRVRPLPAVKYHKGNEKDAIISVRWNLKGIELGSYGADKKVLCWFVRTNQYPVTQFERGKVESLIQFIRKNGVRIRQIEESPKALNVGNNPEKEIKAALEKVKVEDVHCLLVVLPNKKEKDTIYNLIKRYADRAYGIPSICIVWSTISDAKTLGSLAGNLALKFNLKFNNNNQAVEEAGKTGPSLDLDKTMIVGIDVTHSPDQNAPSIAGMVASIDKNLGQWPAILRHQAKAREEMVSELTKMLDTRLRLWQMHHRGSLPENIVVYRDGVSEGQYQLVINHELPKLQDAFKVLYAKDKMPKMTIVIVTKRHHTRFYLKNGNPQAGTVVDRGVTEAGNWDFFLQSHNPVKDTGTARPTHYSVIYDQIFKAKYNQNAADRLESFTHSLCFLFGRCTNAVGICAPAYYADIVCNRARCYVANGESNQKASDAQIVRNKWQNVVFPERSQGLLISSGLRDSMFYI